MNGQVKEVLTKQKVDLGKSSISKLFWYYTIPSVFMLVVQTAAYFVDSVFVGRFIGAEGLSAITLVMPVIIFLGGIAMMIGIGGITLAGIEKGAGNKENSNNIYNVTMALTLISGVVGAIILFLAAPLLMSLLSLTGETGTFAIEYARYTSFFVPFFLMNFVVGFFLKLDGKPLLVTGVMFFGALLNVGLDYMFIVYYELGMRGAAMATGLSQVAPFLICLGVLIWTSDWSFRKPVFRLRDIQRIFYNGFSEFLTSITMAIIGVVFNVVILRRIGAMGIAAFAVVMQLMEFARALGYGIGEGNQSIWSYNFGAYQYDRVHLVRKWAIYVSVMIGALLAGAAFLFGEEISQLFVTEVAVNALSVEVINYAAVSLVFVGFNIVLPTYYTAINDPYRSILLTVYRSFVGPIVGLLILPLIFGDEGIWLTFVYMEVTAFIFGLLLLRKYPLGDKNQKWKVPE